MKLQRVTTNHILSHDETIISNDKNILSPYETISCTIEISFTYDYSILSNIKTSLSNFKTILCKDKLSSSNNKTT